MDSQLRNHRSTLSKILIPNAHVKFLMFYAKARISIAVAL